MNIYSTFYHASKPEGIEQKKAHIVVGGLARAVLSGHDNSATNETQHKGEV